MSAELAPVWGVVAGRMSSTRMPGKTMAPLAGRASLLHIVDRLCRVPLLEGVVIATTDLASDEPIRAAASREGVPVFAGDLDDVLGRTLQAAQHVGATTIVQVTGDCPLVDPGVVTLAVETFLDEQPDYVSTVLGGETWPVGLDVEVFRTQTLAEVEQVTQEPRHREHVSLYIYEHPETYVLRGLQATGAARRPDLRLTLDTPQDYEVIAAIYDALHRRGPSFDVLDVIAFLDERPELAVRNTA